ncbi:MAG TPA: hypothetical protein PK566_15830 [Pseudobacteroides sp.]|nr:hypothetical protein [Pseudobacteroides sp.]
MKKKSILRISILLCISILAITAFVVFISNGSDNKRMQTSQNTTYSTSFDVDPNQTLDDMLPYADLIVKGKVISDGVNKTKEIPGAKYGLKQALTYYQVEIIETLYGSEDSNIITFTQLGEADNDKVEKKVKKGDELLFILHKHPDGYNSVSLEYGLFSVTDGKKVKSLSNGNNLQKYADLDTLKNDIDEKLKKIKKSK